MTEQASAFQPGDSCPDDALSDLAARLGGEGGLGALSDLEALARRYPADARLPFLQGSVLAGARRYEEAVTALQRAVDLAPGYAVARFQLGFLRFTSGAPADAERIWAPLNDRPDGDPFRLFAAGLNRLAIDDIQGGLGLLYDGMAANHDLPQLNRDMQLMVSELAKNGEHASDQEPVSQTHLLLMQQAAKPTRH